jgi:hypothetical protein
MGIGWCQKSPSALLGSAIPGNNGNIASQTVTILNGTPWTTVYQNDDVNRLALANEEPVNEENPACADDEDTDYWCEAYGYDARVSYTAEFSSDGSSLGTSRGFCSDDTLEECAAQIFEAKVCSSETSLRPSSCFNWRSFRGGGHTFGSSVLQIQTESASTP